MSAGLESAACEMCGCDPSQTPLLGIRDRLCVCGDSHRICEQCSLNWCKAEFCAPSHVLLPVCLDPARIARLLMEDYE